MKEANNLKIRINFNKAQEISTQPVISYHYNWQRITIVCFLFITTFTLIMAGSNTYFNQQQKDNIVNQSPRIIVPNAIKNTYTAPSSIEKTTNITTNVAVLQPSVTTTTLPIPSQIKITEQITKESIPTVNEPTGELFTHLKTDILATQIKRFTLAKGIKNKEPVGDISDVKFQNNLATIYAYADIRDLENETLYYQWSLNGKAVAKVKVAIRGDRWRSYSTKFIQANMHGLWQVALQNKQGKNLAIQQFTY